MTYDALLTRIEHADPFERMDALDALRVEADERTVAQTASRLLADADPGVREEAARLLETLATEEAAALTVPYIASDDITVRNLAGEVLMKIGAPAVPALASALDDPHHDVRKFAIDVLAQLPARPLAGCIAARLRDEDDNVVLAAVDALGNLGAVEYHDALRDLYDRRPLARPGIVAALGAFGSEADLGFLEGALADEDPVVQYTAAEALARQHAPEVLDLLLRKVDQVDPMARPVILGSLVDFYEANPDQAALPASLKGFLAEMLGDFDPDYQCAAARGLHAFLDDETVDTLMAHAGETDALDVELFKTLADYPDAFHRIVENVDAGRVAARHAAGFVLGLLAQQRIPEQDLAEVAREADILVAAVGVPEMIRGDWVRPGAAVIDVGMNRLESGLVGDVAFAEARRRAGLITPVPGGVGPLTIAMLIENTLEAFRLQGGANAA